MVIAVAAVLVGLNVHGWRDRLLMRSPNILPIPGTASLAHLRENLAAAALNLPSSEIELLNDIVPRHGDIKRD